jgi:ataxia telangiectasia mutated family protein
MEAAERGEIMEETASSGAGPKSKDEDGHAGRALSVVEKKLSKVLSTAATVSELIQQATDERNLAVLYPGKRFALNVVVILFANFGTGWSAWA